MTHLDSHFSLITGHAPYPWQEALFQRFLSADFPHLIDLPTGAGKTAVLPIWFLALLERIRAGNLHGFPLRLVYVVDRRIVVDQTTREAEKIEDFLRSSAGLDAVGLLQSITASSGDHMPLAISTLRGEVRDNREWSADPSRPAIIVGTVDMIGSRLLFNGYGVSRKSRPIQAGLLSHSTLIILDEAHLSQPFEKLVRQLPQPPAGIPFHVVSLTATPGAARDLPRFPDSLERDLANPHFHRRFHAEKRLEIISCEKEKPEESIEKATKASTGRTLVYVHKPKTAQAIAARLPEGQVVLLTGQMRGFERDELLNNPLTRRFLSPRPDDPATPCWFIATSAGEVGLDLSAQHLITDLDTAPRLLQRFGRLNRTGADSGCTAKLFFSPKEISGDKPEQQRLAATLAYLDSLNGDISPARLFDPLGRPPAAACDPSPFSPNLHPWNRDVWSMTSFPAADWPDRPSVDPWLRGVSEQELPQTWFAWREEVEALCAPDAGFTDSNIEELFESFPVLAAERLYQYTASLPDELPPHISPDTPAILINSAGEPERGKLAGFLKKRSTLLHSTIVLPLSAALLDTRGVMDWEAPPEPPNPRLDVSRVDGIRDKSTQPDPPQGMRRIFSISTQNLESTGEDAAPVEWHYFAAAPQQQAAPDLCTLPTHVEDVRVAAVAVARKLNLQQLHPNLPAIIEWAAIHHDAGKSRPVWQRYAGRSDGQPPLAKPRPGTRPSSTILAGFRHELTSAFLARTSLPAHWTADEQDLALHLIASHHGWARPHFPDSAYDREAYRKSAREALESASRFSRLQRRWGHWTLAFIEACFRTADQLASAGKEFQDPNA